MSLAHYSLTMFVVLNGARAIAYWPQMTRIYHDPGCASAVSVWTWVVFTSANIATVIYALAETGDVIVAAVFGVNTIGCAAVVALTTYKRCEGLRPFWKGRYLDLPSKQHGHSARNDSLAVIAPPGNVEIRDGCAAL